MIRRKKKMTVGKLIRQLESDPEYRRRRDEKAAEHARRWTPVLEIEEAILSELSRLGIAAESLQALRFRGDIPPVAVGLLIGWLGRTDNTDAREAIVRTLGAAKESFDGTALARLFDTTRREYLRWSIANTIDCVHPTGINDWLESRLRDSTYGTAREMLAIAAGRMLEPARARSVLKEVFDQLPGHCADGLGECGTAEDAEFLSGKLGDHHDWVRGEIRKAIKKIRKRVKQNRKKKG